MKKLFYICMVACLAVFGFASCEPEGLVDDTPVTGHPEQDAAGVYVGTWTQVLEGETVASGVEGTITLTADTAYVVSVNVAAASGVSLKDMTSVANIVQESYHGTVFYNSVASNGFGTIFRGRTYTNAEGKEELSLNFILTVKSGRKSYPYNYSFVGVKTE